MTTQWFRAWHILLSASCPGRFAAARTTAALTAHGVAADAATAAATAITAAAAAVALLLHSA
jgi:hypothetical protein